MDTHTELIKRLDASIRKNTARYYETKQTSFKHAAQELREKKYAILNGTQYTINPVAHVLIYDVGSLIPNTNKRASDGTRIIKKGKKK